MNVLDRRLAELIDQEQVTVIETGKLAGHLNAAYHAESKLIFVRWGLDDVTRRCAIAHELGHAYHGHDCSTPSYERIADKWAAENLIALDDVEIAAENCEGIASAIAAEIGVTPQLLSIWTRLHEAGRIKQDWNCLVFE